MTAISIETASDVLREGGVVLLDTDTLPGLHALATIEGAAAKIARIKGHPPERPYLLLVSSIEAAFQLGTVADPDQRSLLKKLWPGELTALLKPSPATPVAWTDAGRTVGVRVPAAPPLRRLLEGLSGPLFSTSANLAGEEPARTLEESGRRFPDLPVLDLGFESSGGASTIVDYSLNPPKLIRTGVVPFEG